MVTAKAAMDILAHAHLVNVVMNTLANEWTNSCMTDDCTEPTTKQIKAVRTSLRRTATIATKAAIALAAECGVNDSSSDSASLMTAVADQAARSDDRIVRSKRTKAAMRLMQSAGKRISSRTTFGWSVDPHDPARVVEDPHEQATIAQIVTLSRSGVSWRAICRELDRRGITCRGHKWHHDVVGRILARTTGQAR